MKIGITKLLPENVAPTNAQSLAIFDSNGNKICNVDISSMQLKNLGEKLYSIGVLSDIHVNTWTNDDNATTFDTAMTFFQSQNCSFVCVSGDLTQTGLWFPIVEGENGTSYYDTAQFDEFERICQKYNFSLYGLAGNHESYNSYDISNTGRYDTYGDDPNLYINTLEKYEEYTGYGLNYAISHGNDVFIFIGQTTQNEAMNYTNFIWLGNKLEENKNKRCFVFCHPYVDSSDSGNPLGLHATPLFDYLNKTRDGYDKTDFINLMSSYPNAILFHGHSHMRFENQESVCNSNYSNSLGFKSVHVPSTAYCRDIRSGEMVGVEIAQGYICDVYTNHIILKGYDFTTSKYVPIAQYCIDTTF